MDQNQNLRLYDCIYLLPEVTAYNHNKSALKYYNNL